MLTGVDAREIFYQADVWKSIFIPVDVFEVSAEAQ
jgi:hypothetical protein